MEVNKVLKREIICELLALLLFVGACAYALFSLGSRQNGGIASYNDVVTILDDKKFGGMQIASDGKALCDNGITYTVTNNQKSIINYEIVIYPNIHNEEVLKQIRVALDDIYISDLSSLDRSQGGYVLGTKVLNSGYTKIHSIKYWYKLDTKKELLKEKVNFNYKIELV